MKFFKRKKKKRTDDCPAEKRTFTKKWVDIILTVSIIDIQLVFVLAFLGKCQIAETLGVAIVSEVIGVMLGYLCKSYFESYSIAKNDLEQERIKNEYICCSSTNSNAAG